MIEKYFVKQAFRKIDLERFFEKHFAKAGFNSLSIVKTPMSTRLIVCVAKPGIAIGYSGKTIKSIGQIVEDKFSIKNPHIEIKSVEDADYNVKYIIQNIVNELEKGINWKQVAYKAVKNLSELPIMGFELIFKGKMMSKGGRKQKYRFVSGYLKVIGDQTKFMKEAIAPAYTKSGAIGVRLKLVPPNVMFPDKIGEKEIAAAIKGLTVTHNDKDPAKVVVEEVATEKADKKEKELDKKIEAVEKSEKKASISLESKDSKQSQVVKSSSQKEAVLTQDKKVEVKEKKVKAEKPKTEAKETKTKVEKKADKKE